MSTPWTKEQLKVIELKDRNILVSAAAGSGKTAVLVERIITMLTRKEDPVDVDQLLVVTFTEAAAAEMKDRIRAAIEQRLEEEPDSEQLRRQATLIHSAQITTIHSFCLSVIREHFHTIDLDPGFRIGEEGELKLLKQDVIKEVLEECYKTGEEEFLNLIEGYGGGRSDKNIEALILRLYEFSRSYPNAGEWLESCVHAYEAETEEALNDTVYYRCIRENTRRYAEGAIRLARQGIELCLAPDGPYMYEEMLLADIEILQKLLEAETYQDYYRCLTEVKWKRLAANKDKTVSEWKAGQVKSVREEVKQTVKDLKGLYFSQPAEEVLEDLKLCRPAMRALTKLTLEFSDAFEEKKRSRNLIDFDDMQQYALRILTVEKDGEFQPSAVAGEYQEQFREVMIDEYQDSNLIQETILTSVSGMSKGRHNIFMVGDVKQSIYRFRLSRPELFMEKYDRYTLEDGEEQRIDLHRNFRSRARVLDSVNAVFRKIMTRALGGVEYDDRAALYAGASYPEVSGGETELLLIEEKTLEAAGIAHRIRSLLKEQMVTDRKTGTLRPVQYRDIVILTRSVKGFADTIAETLMKEGIPVYTGAKEGYFETREIGVLLDYLQVLNNRQQDLPLAAVLTSYFGGMTEEELARIKGSFRGERFFRAVFLYREQGEDPEIRGKLNRCLEQMEKFRRKVSYLALHELLQRILDETGYRDYVAALPGGEQREANLAMLVEKARTFESTSYKGLFHFVRYIEQLKKYEVDYGEASVVDEQSDTVRIMSIHKSKGLEFPVVIAAGMGRRFNRQDMRGNVLLHASLGVGLESMNLLERTHCPSLIKQVIAREELLESMGEELRILYVAMTRAKEKLILTGAAADPEQKLEEAEAFYGSGGKDTEISFGRLAKASCYLDWLIPAAVEAKEEGQIKVRVIREEELELGSRRELAERGFTREMLERWDVSRVYDEEMKKRLEQQMSYQYFYAGLDGKKLKYTVSELKKRTYLPEEDGELLYKEEDVIPLIPKFLQNEQELGGASRGSAYHRVLELLDFTRNYNVEEIAGAIREMEEKGRIQQEMAACVNVEDIFGFTESASGRRMHEAAKRELLWKEQPFVLGVPMTDIYPETEAPADQDAQEIVLVQGIIDVWFEEEDGLVVLDYKTDRVKEKAELQEKYQTQLEYYGKALEQITGKRVKEKMIYSFALGEEIAW